MLLAPYLAQAGQHGSGLISRDMGRTSDSSWLETATGHVYCFSVLEKLAHYVFPRADTPAWSGLASMMAGPIGTWHD